MLFCLGFIRCRLGRNFRIVRGFGDGRDRRVLLCLWIGFFGIFRWPCLVWLCLLGLRGFLCIFRRSFTFCSRRIRRCSLGRRLCIGCCIGLFAFLVEWIFFLGILRCIGIFLLFLSNQEFLTFHYCNYVKYKIHFFI